MKRGLISIFLIGLSILTFAQATITGYVANEQGEYLTSALIFVKGTNFAATTDSKGFYTIENLPLGKYVLETSFLGYAKSSYNIDLKNDARVDVVLQGSIFNIDQIEIISSKVEGNDPVFSLTNIDKKEIEENNLGQDVPYLLQWQPSVIVTSDAGNGIGYTGLRIRGTDPSRINVTLNGVPLNDGESQGVFWVDIPDFLSSVKDIQIQRGVGTSTSGTGAFGGSIVVNSLETNVNPYASISGSLGSFETTKLTLKAGTGLMDNNFTLDARYSLLNSQGYLDRASSDLDSWYFSAGKISSKSSLKLVAFSGHERTYQSWYGSPQSKVEGDENQLLNHYYTNLGSLYNTKADSINLFSSDRRYNYYTYDDQVDDYTQTHLQLHYGVVHNPKINSKTTLFYTKGKGYFEQFRFDDDLANYGLTNQLNKDNQPIESANLVRRRWLDNHLLGLSYTGNYATSEKSTLLFGGTLQKYFGGHYGQVLKSEEVLDIDPKRLYYDNNGNKTDANLYLKWNLVFRQKTKIFLDGQIRNVSYNVKGIDSDLINLDINKTYLFFNPKIGVNHKINYNTNFYASFGIANREPDRSDFIDNPANNTPKHESLYDLESGIKYISDKMIIDANIFYMYYNNQLIQTGDLNDVGSVIRTNTPSSYRLGVELSSNFALNKLLSWLPSITISQNKTKEFTDVLFDYTNGFERIEKTHKNKDIAFSPKLIFSNSLSFTPFNNLSFSAKTKYVGKQYLDNTANDQRSIDPYSFTNFQINYSNRKIGKGLLLSLKINNIFDAKYAANGYTYSYGYQGIITENYLYPQAGINFIIGSTVKI